MEHDEDLSAIVRSRSASSLPIAPTAAAWTMELDAFGGSATKPTWKNGNQVAQRSSEAGLERAEEHGRGTGVDGTGPRQKGCRAGPRLVTNSGIHR